MFESLLDKSSNALFHFKFKVISIFKSLILKILSRYA